jgi:uncharacterized membrane-anchored protein
MSGADELLAHAHAAGLLPAGAQWPVSPPVRPWPVVLLTALGAWLAALPLTGVLMMLLGPVLRAGAGPLLVGALVLAGAVLLLRRPGLPLFVEQLAVPGLLVGGCCLGYGLFRQFDDRLASALLLALCLGVAALVPRPWLRVLLGAAAAQFASLVLLPPRTAFEAFPGLPGWVTVHLCLALWALALWLQRRRLLAGRRAAAASLVEDLACGWLMQLLLALCWLAGRTFLVGGATGLGAAQGFDWRGPGPGASLGMAGSALLALAGAVLAWRAWPGLRHGALAAAALLLAGLAALMPSLGGVLFALALLACSRRWYQAAAAALVAAWVIGAFYYALQWPLAQKALWLAGAGALLALLAAVMARPRAPAWAAAPEGPGFLRGVLVFLLLILGAVNALIWQKQALIESGRPVYVALAPVDPRSLMQGDYMRLAFTLPPGAEALPLRGAERPRVVMGLDERGIARPLRLAQPGAPLATGELLLELTPKDGRWILVTDAWFFREGEAQRFARARFGEFRVAPDGRALLVGLADEGLKSLRP